MKQTSRTVGRTLGATVIVAIWLACAAGGLAAEPAPPPAGDVAVLLDEETLWRHLHLEGPSYLHLDDPTVPVADLVSGFGLPQAPPSVNTAAGAMLKVGLRHGGDHAVPILWQPEWTSSLPSANWAGVTFDDSAWVRAYWPQPIPDLSGASIGDGEVRGFQKNPHPFDTVAVLARSRFEIKDPRRVKACRLSLDYWGGVAVYVNGKEAIRGHLPGKETNLLERWAEAYPKSALPPAEKNIDERILTGCRRQLREVDIPAILLRPGVNVLAVEAHPAPIPYSGCKRFDKGRSYYAWPAIGVLRARLTVSPAAAADTNKLSLRGLHVWNCAVSDTVTAGSDLRDLSAPLRPVLIRAARNSVFSGRLLVGSDQPIRGLKVTVSDLVLVTEPPSGSAGTPVLRSPPGAAGSPSQGTVAGSGKANLPVSRPSSGVSRIAASAVRVRYAAPATPEKSWVPQGRFDGLLDTLPAEIPTNDALWVRAGIWGLGADNKKVAAKALAPLWFTVRVPGNVTAGLYEGRIAIAAQGSPPQTVPLHVRVCDWTMPDPRDWRVQNFIYHAEEVTAKHYGVTNYSDRHFELVSKTLALLAELNSRQVQVNLVCDFFASGYAGSMQSNPESLVRWIKQPDGSFKHDFTNFDRYLDRVAKTIGKPRTLRLNCWGEYNPQRTGTGWISTEFDNTGERPVTVLDPATGRLTKMRQPPLGSEGNYRFWKPVFDTALKKIKERGWLDETTLGYNAWFAASFPKLVDVANKLWPGGEWSFTGHNGAQDMFFRGTDTNTVMTVRHADTVYVRANGRQPLWTLNGPRRNTFIWDCRTYQREDFPLETMRRLVEIYGVNYGYDGLGDFGADLFPLKRPVGGYYIPSAGAGSGWSSDYRSTLALLYPGPDGPVATERFELFREGSELCEAGIFVREALAKKTKLLPPDLQQRAVRYLKPVEGERDLAMNRGFFRARLMQAAEDAKLLDLAGEVAKAIDTAKHELPLLVERVAANPSGAETRTALARMRTMIEYLTPGQLARVYGSLKADKAARFEAREVVGFLGLALDELCAGDQDRLGKLLNDPGAFQFLQAYVRAAAKSANEALKTWAETDGAAFASAWSGLRGAYYHGTNFEKLAFERLDEKIDIPDRQFPYPDGRQDDISVRWTGFVVVKTPGKYTFHSASDDGQRVWVANKLLIDDWSDHGVQEVSGAIELTAGQHPFKVEFYQGGGGGAITVAWSGPGIERQVLGKDVLRTKPWLLAKP